MLLRWAAACGGISLDGHTSHLVFLRVRKSSQAPEWGFGISIRSGACCGGTTLADVPDNPVSLGERWELFLGQK